MTRIRTPNLDDPAAAHLRAAVDRFLARVGHWSDARWATAGRADAVFALAQQLADACADAEGQPRRPVTHLDPLAALTDQIRVLAADLLQSPARDETLRTATTAILAATQSL